LSCILDDAMLGARFVTSQATEPHPLTGKFWIGKKKFARRKLAFSQGGAFHRVDTAKILEELSTSYPSKAFAKSPTTKPSVRQRKATAAPRLEDAAGVERGTATRNSVLAANAETASGLDGGLLSTDASDEETMDDAFWEAALGGIGGGQRRENAMPTQSNIATSAAEQGKQGGKGVVGKTRPTTVAAAKRMEAAKRTEAAKRMEAGSQSATVSTDVSDEETMDDAFWEAAMGGYGGGKLSANASPERRGTRP
jgi:hypothetical protein